MQSPERARERRDQLCMCSGIGLWILFSAVVVITRLHLQPTSGNVFNIYREAAMRWSSGEPLYNGSFVYLPTAALGFVPFAALPFELGGALWRSANLALFVMGIWSVVAIQPKAGRGQFLLIVTLFAALLSWSAARHGQMTLSMGGLMMMSLAAAAIGRFWRAAICLALAVAVKPLAILMLPIVVLLWPRATLKYLVCLGAILSLPLLGQAPNYVIEQYSNVGTMLSEHAQRQGQRVFPQAFSLLGFMGVKLGSSGELIARALAATATVLFSVSCARLLNPQQLVHVLLVFLFAFILLFLPCTERNTYALLAPCIGFFAADAFAHGRTKTRNLMFVAVALYLTNHGLSTAFPDSIWSMGKTIACVLIWGSAVARLSEARALARCNQRLVTVAS